MTTPLPAANAGSHPSADDLARTAAETPTLQEAIPSGTISPDPQGSAGVSEFRTSISATVPSLIKKGTILGSYEIDGQLGEGGMGAVYKATHRRLNKTVAIKVLAGHLSRDPSIIERFNREMTAIGRLEHPNVVRAMDAGDVDGQHFLVMEFVEGTDLANHVKVHGRLTVDNATRALRQAALGLGAAHAAGLVHRDIKPSNLLLTRQGHVKVLDLGLALLGGEDRSRKELTAAGQSFGTPDYMAPEQWNDAHGVDARTDLYALGCTLFFLLVGRAPFADDRHRTLFSKLKAHNEETPPDLKSLRSDVPDELQAIYLKLLAKNPDDRFRSARELSDALAAVGSKSASTSTETKKTTPAETLPSTSPAAPAPATPAFPSFDFPQPPAPSAAPQKRRKSKSSAVPGASTGPKAEASRRKLLIALGVAGGLLAVVMLAGIIIKIKNKDGTTKVIEVEGVDEDAEISFSRHPAAGEKTPLTGKDASKPPATSAPGMLPRAGSRKESVFDINRRAAEAIIAQKGQVEVQTRDWRFEPVATRDQIPKTPFVIRRISLKETTERSTNDLKELAGLRHVRGWSVWGKDVDAGALRLLDANTPIYDLAIGNNAIKTSALPGFPWFSSLHLLWIEASQVDDGWDCLRQARSLRRLFISDYSGSWNTLEGLAKHPHLRHVVLTSAEQPAESLVGKLQAANPNLSLYWDKPSEPLRLLGDDRQIPAAKRMLELGCRLFTWDVNHKVQTLTASPLPEGPWNAFELASIPETATLSADDLALISRLQINNFEAIRRPDADALASVLSMHAESGIFNFSGSDLTDKGLQKLRLPGLRRITLTGTRVTRDGIEAFRKACPAVPIDSDFGHFEADLEARPVQDDTTKAGTVFNVNRRAAEWAVANGHLVIVQTADGGVYQVDAQHPLPSEPHVVYRLQINGAPNGGETDLAPVRGLRHLREFVMYGRAAETVVLEILAANPRLVEAGLDQTGIRMSRLQELPASLPLGLLYLRTSQVDDQWAFLARFPRLRDVGLVCEGETWPDLEPLVRHPSLLSLTLGQGPEPSADVIVRLQRLNPELTLARARESLQIIGESRMQTAAERLLERGFSVLGRNADGKSGTWDKPPVPEGHWNYLELVSSPPKYELPEGERRLLSRLSIAQFVTSGVTNMDTLALDLARHSVIRGIEAHASDLSDEGLRHLQGAPGLTFLGVEQTKVTREGIVAFRKTNPTCVIYSDFGRFAPDFEAIPARPDAVP
jgi:serine/threonine protein kinase